MLHDQCPRWSGKLKRRPLEQSSTLPQKSLACTTRQTACSTGMQRWWRLIWQTGTRLNTALQRRRWWAQLSQRSAGSQMPAEPCVRQEPTISVHDVHDMKIAMVRRGIAAEIAGATSHEADERLRVNQKLQIPGSSHPHWNRRLERAKRRRIYYAASVPLEFAPKTIRSPSWPPSMMP